MEGEGPGQLCDERATWAEVRAHVVQGDVERLDVLQDEPADDQIESTIQLRHTVSDVSNEHFVVRAARSLLELGARAVHPDVMAAGRPRVGGEDGPRAGT